MKRLLFTIVTITAIAVSTFAADIADTWSGKLKIGLQELPLVINIAENDDSYTATLDSPAQGARDIPAEVSVNGDSISVIVPVIGARYNGVVIDEQIEGIFSQNGMRFPLTLQRGPYVPPRPQTPVPPFPYETREVSITNPADGYVLNGTLTIPLQARMGWYKNYPAAILVTGSGIQNRDEEVFSHKPFAVLAHELAMTGIATLRYDDRGYNDTTGIAAKATTETFASDAKAALRWLKQSDLSIGKTGVIGHSEGGLISFMLGADDDADFIVSLAGAAIRGDSLLIEQNKAILLPSIGAEATSQYLIALHRLFRYMEKHPHAHEWAEAEQSTSDLSTLSPQLVKNLQSIIATRTPWLDWFLTHDPAEYISRTHCPVMAVNGSLDMQVNPTSNLDAIRNHLPSTTPSLIKEYPGLNHLLQNANTGYPDEYLMIEETLSPTVISDIASWIKTINKSK